MAAKLGRQAKQQLAIIMPIMVTAIRAMASATPTRCEILKIVMIIDKCVKGATAQHCASERASGSQKEVAAKRK